MFGQKKQNKKIIREKNNNDSFNKERRINCKKD